MTKVNLGEELGSICSDKMCGCHKSIVLVHPDRYFWVQTKRGLYSDVAPKFATRRRNWRKENMSLLSLSSAPFPIPHQNLLKRAPIACAARVPANKKAPHSWSGGAFFPSFQGAFCFSDYPRFGKVEVLQRGMKIRNHLLRLLLSAPTLSKT